MEGKSPTKSHLSEIGWCKYQPEANFGNAWNAYFL